MILQNNQKEVITSNRRIRERRKCVDRRTMIRFETVEPRRSLEDRRMGMNVWASLHQ